MSEPVVSISCITYNHVEFIAQCLESFLMQKTNFKFEILINDDASSDGTQDVIKRFEKEYPDIIKPIYQKENQYSKGKRMINFRYNTPRAQGKYIALCEGDDYWIDPLKLQKQVDFLESNNDYSLVFSNRMILEDNQLREQSTEQTIYTIKDTVSGFIPSTQTILLRADPVFFSFINKHLNCDSGDRVLAFYCSTIGKLKRLKDVTAVYRVHDGGVWSRFGRNFESELTSIQRLINFKKDIVEPEIGSDHNNVFLLKLAERNLIILVRYGFFKFVKSYLIIIKTVNPFKYTFNLVCFLMKRILK